ncbi:Tpr-related protein family member, putative [Theileria annulata]|uniref:Tpr-related protein family member, putative n=1 Tax=Theileria annulata TaxID=5874 RepID=Q4UIA6_THEAN|nr:Tpr-related protein family member, putative [Theileria annulata]CAI73183.1 Tpr-related protein family member, putative [Theileria annulata]|eukprot:XP_953861.1 Tpr-related protein family member, putative [Theileria annulata]
MPTTNYKEDPENQALQIVAYMFAGLAMMLNIRLSYSAAPYALLRFKLPENLFSVFVRTTSSALELWCIPSMLIGNIMEQFYNHTQDTSSYHYVGLKNYASEIEKKAGKLKTIAGAQSTSELASTENTDLQQSSNYPQTKLEGKANLLKGAAQLLHKVAKALEEAVQNDGTLNPLKDGAGKLKDAAKTTGSGGLFEKAEALAGVTTSENASSQADKVIKAFDKVETQYTELINTANTSGLTNDSKVIEVVKSYHEVKTIYYQMIITFRIKQKAEAFHSAAEELQTQAGKAQPSTNPKLKALNTHASAEMGDLVAKANQLKTEAEKLHNATDANIVTKYLAVVQKYNELEKKPAFKAALEDPSSKSTVEKATKEFSVLKKSFENVLMLRVQELSEKSGDLKNAASALSSDSLLGLTEEAGKLRDAAMSSTGTEGLKQKATALVTAIKGASGGNNAEATKVITAFEDVTAKYQALTGHANYNTNKGNAKVIAVDDAYKDLQKVYDSILNLAKLAKKTSELNSAASDPTKVIENFNAVVTAYNALDRERKSQVQKQFEALQTEYSEAIYKYKFHIITVPSMITNWLNFLTFVILLIIFVTGGDQGHVTGYYVIMAISGFVFGINMVLVYAVDYRYLPFYMAGENSFPMVTSMILYFATSIFGNRRKYNSDYVVVVIDVSIAILIALVAASLWTVAFYKYRTPKYGDLTPDPLNLVSPVAMVIVGMGLVYSIYPGIAPGMIVPFYLIDKIEMVLLVATAFPPVIIAILRLKAPNWSPSTKFVWHGFGKPNTGMGGWKRYASDHNWAAGTDCAKDNKDVHGWIWHFFDILIPLQISLAVIFIYSIHYRDSNISRSIVNQPKMSTFLTIVFYMCHEILLALGFPGMVGNGGAGGQVLLPVQYVGALLMVFLAFYSIGYITEYKRHDPSKWPTEGMTKWNAMCYWLKMASKITNKNFKQLFTTDLRRDLVLSDKETKFIIHVNINSIYTSIIIL